MKLCLANCDWNCETKYFPAIATEAATKTLTTCHWDCGNNCIWAPATLTFNLAITIDIHLYPCTHAHTYKQMRIYMCELSVASGSNNDREVNKSEIQKIIASKATKRSLMASLVSWRWSSLHTHTYIHYMH